MQLTAPKPDRSCINRRSKRGASVSGLTLNRVSKSTGRKSNSRKRSNKKRADIEKVVNIFAENEIVNFTLHSFAISKQR